MLSQVRVPIAKMVLRAAIVTVVMGGATFAHWVPTGSGGDTTPSNVVVVQTSSAAGLYPGGSIALSGDFDNHNAGAVTLAAVTAVVHPFSTQPDITKPACTQSDFTITGTSNTPGSIRAGSGVGVWDGLTLNMIDKIANQGNCKNLAGIQIDYRAT